jgi:amino acid adenylation domain-containing protein/non-ribosomal peptide synthase protein (TIGR01720 family)
MDIGKLLIQFENSGIKLWVEDERLAYWAPKDALTSELRSLLQKHKTEIIGFLQGVTHKTQDSIPRVSRESEELQLSFAQQRLWFLNQLEGHSPTYNIPVALRLEGPLDQNALEQSFCDLVQRHETLRTVLPAINGKPVVRILENSFRMAAVADLTALSPNEQEEEVKQLIEADIMRPFNMETETLFRVSLIRLNEVSHVLLLCMHHIISDGWSLGILVRELSTLYEAFVENKPSPLSSLPIQYVDYAHWQRQWLAGELFEKQLDYWKTQLANTPELLELPTDKPRPPVQSYQGDTLEFFLSPELTTQLNQLSRQTDTTLFMNLLSAFATLLYRYSGQTDIVIGSPIAGRTHNLTELLIGFFVNTLMLRLDLSVNPPFEDILRQAKRVALEAYANQDIPFEHLVMELKPKRSMSHSPLFQVMFVLQNTEIPVMELSGLTVSYLEMEGKIAQFDLSLVMEEKDQGLKGVLEYNTDLYESATIQRMIGHFKTILEAMVENPTCPISELSMITQAEQQQLLSWNETTVDYPQDKKTIIDLFEKQVEEKPDAIAVVFDDDKLSYRELNAKANQLGHYLQSLGVKPEIFVGLCLERSLEMIIGLLGILKAGGTYVPLDPVYPTERLAFMLEDTQLAVLLTQSNLTKILPETQAQLVCLDGIDEIKQMSYLSRENPLNGAGPDHLAYLIYTSGSTGKPKGVMIEHNCIINHCCVVQAHYQLCSSDRVLQFTSLNFDPSLEQIFATLITGARLVLRENSAWSIADLHRKIYATAITVADIPPAFLKEWLVEWAHLPEYTEPNPLRLVIVGGEVMLPEILDLWQQTFKDSIRLINAYGPTEATITTTTFEVTSLFDVKKAQKIPIGYPLANKTVYILDTYNNIVPIGVPGELHIGGAGLARGYLNRPNLTAENFIRNPFADDPGARLYKSGDLARYLPNGNIEFLGRVDNQVKIRGFRIELGEIESVLRQHPDVTEGVVVVHESSKGDKHLVAYLVGRADGVVEIEEIQNYLKGYLPRYMVPSNFITLDTLPLTPAGKVDRRKLSGLPVISVSEKGFIAPQTPEEERLANIWSTVLDVPKIGIHDDFFELGGHSLLATQVISRVRDTFNVDIPLRVLFESPTIEDFCKHLTEKHHESSLVSPMKVIDRSKPLQLSFAQQRLWFINQLEGASGTYNIPGALSLEGPLDITLLEKSLAHLVDRHETLRTCFPTRDGKPTVKILNEPFKLTLIDLKSLPANGKALKSQQILAEEANRPFDLEKEFLFRGVLIGLEAEKNLLLLNMHHIISDDWSIGVLIKEWSLLYKAFSENQAYPLPPLAYQYVDFAHWQRSWLKGEVMERQLQYWQDQLSGIPELLELPTDFSRPAVQSYKGNHLSVSISTEITRALKELSTGSTLFMTLLSAFSILLSRYSRQDDIVIGSPIAGRNYSHTEALVGFFVNTLVLRLNPQGDLSFEEFLTQTRKQALEAYNSQDIPFEQLVEELSPERSLSHSPLFQVMFVLQNAPMVDFELAGLRVSSLELESQNAKFDLTLSLEETPAGLAGYLEYSTDLFERATIQRMVGHLKVLLEGISENPTQKIRELHFLTPAEEKQLLAWNKTDIEYPLDKTIIDLFEQQVEKNPDVIAVVFEDQKLTYGELNAKANQLAHYLRGLGVKPEVLVGICVERSLEMIIGLLGILKAGGAYVPLDPDYPRERLDFMIKDAAMTLLITQSSLQKKLPETTTTKLIGLDVEIEELSRLSVKNPDSKVGANNPAYVIYTSGSTGTPKGVVNTHRGICNRLLWMQDVYRLTRNDRVLQKTTYSFDVSVWEFFWPLLVGARLVFAKPGGHKDSAYLVKLIISQQITTLHFVPSMLQAFVEEQNLEACTSLKRVICSGEALPFKLQEDFFKRLNAAELHNLYGPTEAAIDVTYWECQRESPLNNVPIGHPIANTQIYVLDTCLQPIPIGVPGELHIGGVGLARGYLNRPELTAEKFIADPFSNESSSRLYKSGDMARYLPDGNIEYLGRIDNQIKIRGFRIELGEIESVLGQYPLIKEGVVVVHESSKGDKRLVAYLVVQKDKAFETEGVKNYLKGYLPDYMRPSNFITLDALPLTPNGKVDRKKLSLLAVTGVSEKSFVAPRTPAEKILAEIWSDLLDIPKIGVHDSFFELGGDSIISIQAISRAKKVGFNLTPKQLFQYQTIAELARLAGTVGVVTLAEQGIITGNVALTPIQYWFFERAFVEENHFNQSAFIKVSPKLSPDKLDQIVTALVEHHDILRARFSSNNRAQWITKDCSVEIDVKDLSLFSSEEQKNVIESTTEALQKSLNIETGPLFRVALFQLGPNKSNRLFIVIHHLTVDGVSWRILLEDVTTAFYQFEKGESINLPAKTTSYQEWATHLKDYANSEMIKKETDYWLNELRKPVQLLPKEVLTKLDLETKTNEVIVSLSQEQTSRLLKEVHGAYGTQINDILLAALLQSITWWTREETLLIALEGHGREALFEDIDLSRTVGWFTAIFPVVLDIRGVVKPGEIIKRVKEQLRAIPNHGTSFGILRYLNSELSEQLQSFPQPQVSFNYLGQFDTSSNDLVFGTASERVGVDVSPLNSTGYILDINGLVSKEQLSFIWTYDKNYFNKSIIEEISNRFKTSLIEIINHCHSMVMNGIREYTPSDFPLAQINQATLDKIAATGNLEDLYPLSPMQEGMLFHSLYDPDSSVYFQQMNIGFKGVLNKTVFQNAWETVVNRYEVLRSACVWGNIYDGLEKPHLRLFTSVLLPWVSEDWRGDEKQEQRLQRFLEEDRKTGFDLTKAPLMRFALIQRDDDRFNFIWSFHHLLMDGWCLPIIIKDVLTCYDAFCNHLEVQLPEVSRYRDYLVWLSRQNLETAKEFWQLQLKGFSSPTTLRLDKGSSKEAAEEYKEISLTLPTETTRTLQAFVKAHHLTMNILFQGAWSILLSRYSGEEEVLFGATVSGRPSSLEGVEAMVGLFINTLPVRVSVTKKEPLVPWLSRLHENQVERDTYGYTPLVEIHKWSEIASNIPLFESLLVFENYPLNAKQMEDNESLSIDAFDAFEQTNYPLTLSAGLIEEELTVRFSYSTTHFSEDIIQRMMGHLTTLLEGIVTEDKSPVEIEILTEREKNQLLDWNQTATEYPQDKTIIDLFEQQVDKSPDAIAVVFEDKNSTYRELNEKANRLAHYLQDLGVKPEVLVGICVERTLEMSIGLLGILKAGGAYVPLDPDYPLSRLQFMLEDSSVSVLLSQSHLQHRLPVMTENGAKVVCLDNEWEQIAAVGSGENPVKQTGPENLAYVIYTSGSTGVPKGVMVEHRNVLAMLYGFEQVAPARDSFRGLSVCPFSFDVSVWEFFINLCFGGTLHLVDLALLIQPASFVDYLFNQQINCTYIPPALLESVIDELETRPVEVTLQRLLIGVEPIKQGLMQRYRDLSPNLKIINGYGPTETTICATFYPFVQALESERQIPIGKPVPGYQIYLMDSGLQPAPLGIPSELCIAGRGLARGYFNRPELTAEKFLEIEVFGKTQRIYKTGDLARYLPDGNIEFLGRVDNQVKIRGFRIELGEIETALGQHPEVRETVVISRETAETGKHLVAYFVPQQDSIENADIRRFLSERLPEYMIPSIFVALETLPLLPNGKVDRRALPEPGKLKGDEASYIAPRNEIEKTISTIWQAVLKVENPGINDNFFELGGHSLLIIRAQSLLAQALKRDIPVVDLFRYPTINTLAKFLSEGEEQVVVRETQAQKTGAIAIIGMAGRFPGARNLEEFWQNLREGVESISFFTDQELIEAGIEPELVQNPKYVKAKGILDDIEMFDANFFGFTPKEAEIMDPQHRLFIEVAWEALENSGYNPDTSDRLIGVYAGSDMNTYLFENLVNNADILESLGFYQIMLSNDKDFLSTQLSYKLNLKGPSVNISTACSTSLVAIQMAFRSLLAGECDMALAGGVTISTQKIGYLYQEGNITSPDGHCRAFDAKAQGTVSGNGVGIVVLKRLDDALRDRDSIQAVIKGGVINNDGSEKVGYTAPGVYGQMMAISGAQAMAGIDPGTISYVETHGTGTILGDPIEVEALTRAFRRKTDKKGYCAIGSVKTNIGHLDTAAGVAGFIKTVLSIKHKELFPSLHFEKPNPKIDFENSPFYVNTKLSKWQTDDTPRRAGVSSFGIGGTNAHLILEEAPSIEPSGDSRAYQLLILSAQTESALDNTVADLCEHLKRHPELNLADVAYTLQVGRKPFAHRRILVCQKIIQDAVETLEQQSERVFSHLYQSQNPSVIFMFPGVSDHYFNMARSLYKTENIFRETVDRCCELLQSQVNLALKTIIYPEGIDHLNETDEIVPPVKAEEPIDSLKMFDIQPAKVNTGELNRYAQPAVFVIEYALAQLLMEWGIKPHAMIGYSTGEYTAACLSGVLSLEDALFLLGKQVQLIEELPPGGAMLAVYFSEQELIPLIENKDVYLAMINGSDSCVLSGNEESLTQLKVILDEKGIMTEPVVASQAFHSALMKPAGEAFAKILKQVKLGTPQIPYISNVTGTWITETQATDPGYWVQHLCGTVRFSEGLHQLFKEDNRVLIEVGPGQNLGAYAMQHLDYDTSTHFVYPTMKYGYENSPDLEMLLTTLGKLFLVGVDIDWQGFYWHEKRLRLPLPTYPFERHRYWIEPQQSEIQSEIALKPSEQRLQFEDWFSVPIWKRSPADFSKDEARLQSWWLCFMDDHGWPLVERMEKAGLRVIRVSPGDKFNKVNHEKYMIDPRRLEDYQTLINDLQAMDRMPGTIVHLWGLSDETKELENIKYRGFYSLLFITQALDRNNVTDQIRLTVVSNALYDVIGDETLNPAKALMLGPVKVIPQEYTNIICQIIDIAMLKQEMTERLVEELLTAAENTEPVIALRGRYRWVQSFEKIRIKSRETGSLAAGPHLKSNGVYLITGGLGNVGLTLAQHLARTVQAKLVLVSRRTFPEKAQWKQWLENNQPEKETSRVILKLLELEELGANVMVLQADVADEQHMRDIVEQTEKRFGKINGVIHAAGVVSGRSVCPIKDISAISCEDQFIPKVHGLLVLEKVLAGKQIDFCLLMSSLSAVLGGLEFVAYSAANLFMDAFVYYKNKIDTIPWISVNWDGWQFETEELSDIPVGKPLKMVLMNPDEGANAFERILSTGQETQIVVSTTELQTRINQWIRLESVRQVGKVSTAGSQQALSAEDIAPTAGSPKHPRPPLSTEYIAPRDETEKRLAEIWEKLLGIGGIGVQDIFFELGGDSLEALQVVRLIGSEFSVELTIQKLFEAPTIGKLARLIKSAEWAAQSADLKSEEGYI